MWNPFSLWFLAELVCVRQQQVEPKCICIKLCAFVVQHILPRSGPLFRVDEKLVPNQPMVFLNYELFFIDMFWVFFCVHFFLRQCFLSKTLFSSILPMILSWHQCLENNKWAHLIILAPVSSGSAPFHCMLLGSLLGCAWSSHVRFLDIFTDFWWLVSILSPGDSRIEQVVEAFSTSGLVLPAGIATSLMETGQQWFVPPI